MARNKKLTCQKQSLPISVFGEYEAGVLSAKSTLCQFYGSAHMDFHSKEMWEAVKKSLKLIKEAPGDEPWGRIQWGNHPWQVIEVKDKWEFLEKYIKPVIEKYRPLIHEYDDLTQSAFNQCESDLKELELKDSTQPDNNRQKSPETIAKAKRAQELRAEGWTQQAIADELKVSQPYVAETLLITDTGNNVTSVGYKSELSDRRRTESAGVKRPVSRGNSVPYKLARIKRDFPEVVDQIGKGKKYPSVSAAAVALGIDKKKTTIQFPADESGSRIVERLRKKLTSEQLVEIRDALIKTVGD